MEILEITEPRDLAAVFPVLAELRPALTPGALEAAFPVQRAEGYRLFAVFEGGRPAACMGWRILNKLHEGRTLYIDDLVTAAASRRRGFAQALLALAEDHARRAGCRSVTLDSGHQRFDAHRTYLNAGFRIVSHHFTRDL